MARLFSSTSVETTLASGISSTATSMTVATGTGSGLVTGVTIGSGNQFTVAIDPDTTNEEIVFITAQATDTFTIERQKAGTTGVAHSAGATVRHVLTSDDLNAFNAAVSPVTNVGFAGSTSGTTTVQATAVAGTTTLTLPAATDTLVGKATTDTLTNKTINLTSNTLVATSAQLATAVTDETGTGSLVFANSPTLVTPALGTPSALTLTNATGLPITGITASTSAALGVGSIELGNASDTTLTRSAAGRLAVEGDNVVTVASTDTLTNKTLTSPIINLAFNAQTGTTYTFALTDNGRLVTASNASAQTYSIPTNASVAFPVGTQINIQQIGAGQVTINAVTAGTTTITSTGATATAPKLRAQYSAATCIKTGTDTWTVLGDII